MKCIATVNANQTRKGADRFSKPQWDRNSESTGLSLCFHLDKAERERLTEVAAFYEQQQQPECQYEARPKRQREAR